MIKGEIYQLNEIYRKYYPNQYFKHAFVYWADDGEDIRGIMLTTSSKEDFNNIPLQREHINPKFPFKYGKSEKFPISYIAPLYLLKKIDLAHFTKKGELTETGIEFISKIIPQLKFTDWKSHKGLR